MALSSAEETDDGLIVFGYWDIRGLGQAIRYVLEYAGLQYDEHRYPLGEKLDGRQEWLKVKFTLGLDFPNLPYLKMGKVRMSQSLAILRFLARRTGLFPGTEEGQQRVDLAEQQVYDIIWHNVRVCYDSQYSDKKKEEYMKQYLELYCPQLETFLGDRSFIVGDELTYVDFLAYEMFDQHRVLWPEYEKMYAPFPQINAYLQRLEALPKFAKFLQSDKYKAWPVWSELSYYGGPAMPPPRPPIR
ncbi:glutathione S-transferase Mu 5-like [Varroa jacobsoni]|uniref:glutathione S-transferase Mu 5-like n=1 Tax=Varroa jacobsoni TaxID=62625 RepID=UPI000BF5A78A|nr:glutathione S-transferase Mu 5-like [Varroa jacobsoni]